MNDYLDQGEVKQIIVQRTDGSTWTAEVDLDGRIRLLKQLSDPTREASKEEKEAEGYAEPEDGKSDEGEDGEESEAEEQQGEMADEYTDEEIEKLIEQMKHREWGRDEFDRTGREIEWTMPTDMLAKLKDNAFKARLSSVMLDNKFDRRVKGRTRGKLDMTRLYKVPTGSRNVFQQKQARKGKNYSVVLLIDESGSMQGRKSELAAEAAVFLTKQMTDLGINVGIIGFESEVHVHKELHEKADYEYIYSAVRSAPGDNSDYQGLRRAYHMLRHAPEGKKVLIMLSDGNPTGFYNQATYDSHGKREDILPKLDDRIDWESKEHFHHLVRSQKDVASIGIGIEQGGWQIPDHEVIHEVEDLKKTIIKQLRKHIRRG